MLAPLKVQGIDTKNPLHPPGYTFPRCDSVVGCTLVYVTSGRILELGWIEGAGSRDQNITPPHAFSQSANDYDET